MSQNVLFSREQSTSLPEASMICFKNSDYQSRIRPGRHLFLDHNEGTRDVKVYNGRPNGSPRMWKMEGSNNHRRLSESEVVTTGHLTRRHYPLPESLKVPQNSTFLILGIIIV